MPGLILCHVLFFSHMKRFTEIICIGENNGILYVKLKRRMDIMDVVFVLGAGFAEATGYSLKCFGNSMEVQLASIKCHKKLDLIRILAKSR